MIDFEYLTEKLKYNFENCTSTTWYSYGHKRVDSITIIIKKKVSNKQVRLFLLKTNASLPLFY